MGIGPHAIKLTRIVRDAGLLRPGFSVIELGSQDFAPTLPAAREAISREFGFGADGIGVPADLYRAMGSSRYECIDLDGYHNARVFDLNADLGEKYGFRDTFDFVTNHGTTEHLFNQLEAFRNIHRMTAVGGVMLHALPFQGYQNHGMFNYSASLFLDLAIANDYEVFGLFLSIEDRLYAYDEDFLARNHVASAEDTLLLAVLVKKAERTFEAPYDGRYFSVHGKGEVAALATHVGTTRRSAFGSGRYVIEGLDESGPRPAEKAYANRFITPLWGEAFVESFCEVTLPSQLADGNLPAFPRGDCLYTIVTTARDAEAIKTCPGYRALCDLMPVEFLLHEGRPGEQSYERMTRAYNLALERVAEWQTCFFLTADDFYSDGLLRGAGAAIEAGKRVVMVPTIRVVAESFRAELETSSIRALGPAELVGLMLRHEHPMITACVVGDDSRLMHRLPAQTLARIGHGYVGRWNVMHPLAVRLPPRPQPIRSTVDWNYPALHVVSATDIHVVRDSDEGVIASLAPFAYSQSEELTYDGSLRRRIGNLKRWVEIDWALNFHVLQMSEPVVLHAAPIEPAERDRALRQVDAVWRPFRDYIERRRVPVPAAASGHALDLLTRAVRRRPLAILARLIATARRRLVRSIGRRIYQGVQRRLSSKP